MCSLPSPASGSPGEQGEGSRGAVQNRPTRYGFGSAGADNRAGFQRWLETTRCDTLVFLDRLPGPLIWEQLEECGLHADESEQADDVPAVRFPERRRT